MCDRPFMIATLQIYYQVTCQWKGFENRPISDEDMELWIPAYNLLLIIRNPFRQRNRMFVVIVTNRETSQWVGKLVSWRSVRDIMSKPAETREVYLRAGEWIGRSNEFSEAYIDAITETMVYSPVVTAQYRPRVFSIPYIHTCIHTLDSNTHPTDRPVIARVKNLW